MQYPKLVFFLVFFYGFGDLITTFLCQEAGMIELNPLIRWFLTFELGYFFFLFYKTIIIILSIKIDKPYFYIFLIVSGVIVTLTNVIGLLIA